MKIHIVDDEQDVLASCQFLVQQLGYQNTALWENGLDFVEGADLFEPAVAILDLRMPKMDGQQVIEYLNTNKSTIAPVILTGHGELTLAVDLFKSGVIDFLEKPVSMMALEDAILLARKSVEDKFRSFSVSQMFNLLTDREKQVTKLVFEGATNKEISDALATSIRTVEVQRASSMKKLQAETLADFVTKLTEVKGLLL